MPWTVFTTRKWSVGLAVLSCLWPINEILAQQPGKRGEFNAPPAFSERIVDTLRVGDKAPDFTLSDPQGKRQVTLSSFRGKKPVMLIFGSYT